MKLQQWMAIAVCLVSSTAMAEPKATNLIDYARDFTEVGYEIIFKADARYYRDPLSAGQTFLAYVPGYRVLTSADKLSRDGRREFFDYFNKHCKYQKQTFTCIVEITGEVELNEEYRVVVWAVKIGIFDPATRQIIEEFS